MTNIQRLLIAEVLICFSGITYLLFFVALFFVERMVTLSPLGGIVLLVIVAGTLGLFGAFRLAEKVIFDNCSEITDRTYFFVYLGISTAMLPAVVGLFTGIIPLILIGWTAIISAWHLINLSKQVKPVSGNSPDHESKRAFLCLQSTVRDSIKVLSRFLLFLCIAPTVFLAMWILARESTIAWYGFGLEIRASEHAEKIADGNEYCLIASRGAITFEELDKREIITDVFDRHFGHDSFAMGFSMGDPNFGIKVEDVPYYWSFGEDQFIKLPRYDGDTRCAKDIQPSFFGRRPL